MSSLYELFGEASWLLLYIPVALLVRLLVKRSRWSVLRVTVVSLLGVVVADIWLLYIERALGVEPGALCGRIGKTISEYYDQNMGRPYTNILIANGLFFLWLMLALMDALIATARFFINKPYIKEIEKVKVIEKVKWIEKEKPVKQTEKKPSEKKPTEKTQNSPVKKDISSVDEAPDYRIPAASILQDGSNGHHKVTQSEIDKNIAVIKETLADHHVHVSDIEAIPGPTVTLYKIYPAKGVKVAAIRNLTDDVSVALKAGKVISSLLDDCVGMEVANRQRSAVSMRELVESGEFKQSDASLPVAIGREVTGDVKVFDLADAPHLLIGGATGQGKSVCLNVLVASLLYAKRPSELKLVFIDPKKTEFSRYSHLYSHYLAVTPDAESQNDEKVRCIVKDTKSADIILRSLCQEMSDRYDLLEKAGTPEIKEYNAKYIAHKLNPQNGHRYLPYIVTIIDEYAQLLQGTSPEAKVSGRSIITSILSIAAMGRAAGLHLVIATQSPRREVVSGLIKANFPMSIALKVKTDVDSRVILDEMGAEKLLGKGDMLISKNADTDRVQCGFIAPAEIDSLMRAIESQQGYKKSFSTPYYLPEVKEEDDGNGAGGIDMKKLDERFEEAARYVVINQFASTSNLQTNLSMGYARSARVMSQLEAAGIVGPQNGAAKKREVLVGSLAELEPILKSFIGN
ncbi:MAG: DNA translocase FtsK [Bacteroidales bacterium]|nr:DNA translocase FtsK [Bacteroidales bacterium]